MKKHHWFDFVEYFSLVGLGAGSVLSLVSKQVLFTSAPLSFALLVGFANRRRVEQAQEQKLIDSLSMLDQKLTKSIKVIDQQVQTLPTPEMIGDVRQSILRHGREEMKRLSNHIGDVRKDVEERLDLFDRENLGTARQEINQLHHQYSEIYNSLTEISNAINQAVTSEQMDQVDAAIADLTQQAEKLQTNLQTLDEYNKHTMSNLQEQVNQVNRQMKSLPPPVDAAPLKRDLSELVRVVADLVPKRDLNNLVAEVRTVQQWQESRAQIDQGLRQDLQAVRQRLQSIPDVPQLRSQIEETFTQEIRAINRQLRTLHSAPEMRTRIEEVLKEELTVVYQQLAERLSNNPYDLVFDLASGQQFGDETSAIAGSRLVLEEALEKSQERLILIWPWSDYVELDHALLTQMEAYLRRQKILEVGWCHLSDRQSERFLSKINRRWAINPFSQGQIQGTLKRLLALKRRYPDHFRFKILGMVENFLISDSSFAVLGIQERLKTQTTLHHVDLKLRTTDDQVVQQLTQRFDQEDPAPEDTEAYWNRAVTRYDLGDKAGAIHDLNAILAVVPDEAAVYNLRGIIRYDQKDVPGAIEDLNQSLRILPDQVSAYCNRGYIQSEHGNYEEAIADFNTALDIAADSAIAFFYRAIAYQKLEQPLEALRDYSATIDYAPESAPAYYERGLVYRSLDCFSEAIADLSAAVQLFADSGQAKNAQVAERQLAEVNALAETQSSMPPPPLPPMEHPAPADEIEHPAPADEMAADAELDEADLEASRSDLFSAQESEPLPPPLAGDSPEAGESEHVPDIAISAGEAFDAFSDPPRVDEDAIAAEGINAEEINAADPDADNIHEPQDAQEAQDAGEESAATAFDSASVDLEPDSTAAAATPTPIENDASPLGSTFNEAFGDEFGQAFGDEAFPMIPLEDAAEEVEAPAPEPDVPDIFIPDVEASDALATDETLIEPVFSPESSEPADVESPDALATDETLIEPVFSPESSEPSVDPSEAEVDDVIPLPAASFFPDEDNEEEEENIIFLPAASFDEEIPDAERSEALAEELAEEFPSVEPLPPDAPTIATFDLFADSEDVEESFSEEQQDSDFAARWDDFDDSDESASDDEGEPPALDWVDQFSDDVSDENRALSEAIADSSNRPESELPEADILESGTLEADSPAEAEGVELLAESEDSSFEDWQWDEETDVAEADAAAHADITDSPDQTASRDVNEDLPQQSVTFDLGQNVSSTEETAILEVFGQTAESSVDPVAEELTPESTNSVIPNMTSAPDPQMNSFGDELDPYAWTETLDIEAPLEEVAEAFNEEPTEGAAAAGDRPTAAVLDQPIDAPIINAPIEDAAVAEEAIDDSVEEAIADFGEASAPDVPASETADSLAAVFDAVPSEEHTIEGDAIEEHTIEDDAAESQPADEQPIPAESEVAPEATASPAPANVIDEPSVIGIIDDNNNIGNLFWGETADNLQNETAPAASDATSNGVANLRQDEQDEPTAAIPDGDADLDPIALPEEPAVPPAVPQEDSLIFANWPVEDEADASAALETGTDAEADIEADAGEDSSSEESATFEDWGTDAEADIEADAGEDPSSEESATFEDWGADADEDEAHADESSEMFSEMSLEASPNDLSDDLPEGLPGPEAAAEPEGDLLDRESPESPESGDAANSVSDMTLEEWGAAVSFPDPPTDATSASDEAIAPSAADAEPNAETGDEALMNGADDASPDQEAPSEETSAASPAANGDTNYQETNTLVDWFAAFEDDEPVSLINESPAPEPSGVDFFAPESSPPPRSRRRSRDTDTQQIGVQTLADFMSAIRSETDPESPEAIARRPEVNGETSTFNQDRGLQDRGLDEAASDDPSNPEAGNNATEPPRVLDDLFMGSPELNEPDVDDSDRDPQAMGRWGFDG